MFSWMLSFRIHPIGIHHSASCHTRPTTKTLTIASLAIWARESIEESYLVNIGSIGGHSVCFILDIA
jgi:hypothetical protein